jgi:hypothetical protein
MNNIKHLKMLDAPRYHLGFTSCIFFVVLYIMSIMCIGHLQKIQARNSNSLDKLGADDDIDMGEMTKGLLLADSEAGGIHEELIDYPHSSSRTRHQTAKDVED